MLSVHRRTIATKGPGHYQDYFEAMKMYSVYPKKMKNRFEWFWDFTIASKEICAYIDLDVQNLPSDICFLGTALIIEAFSEAPENSCNLSMRQCDPSGIN
ncbi:hypothetical protein CEXT_387871 [Caerostris extrusa]|uniref:DNA-directed DNA polymerase n=1 Tax=Caerostris extrusa TaxID=172846 RepID=A0AAV4XB58_CAEEX|nr:hypothetical protein CEXT_387871 [Caerostris extrusa]